MQEKLCPSCGDQLEPEACVVILPGQGWKVVPGFRCTACRGKRPSSGAGEGGSCGRAGRN
ncbi:hypothetical protein [Desulfovirgula thermocuniculi]|uniref:hypothetical protein n=1 Tax=Desulfovirgula thermocuniculi TaxID=348842 RepID=UPI0012EC89D5|nr:hypothetical protein [Desulfovirgula thermocuniculi]